MGLCRQQASLVGQSVMKSARNVGDPSLIPESGRSAGEGIGYPLQYSWASFVAQLVKNPPAMWETWFRSLDWDDPLEKGKATHSSILAWRIPWKKSYDQLRQHMKSRDITLPIKVHLITALVFPVVMYGCESWTIKKAEHRRIDAFELWCWRRLLRVPWTAKRSN